MATKMLIDRCDLHSIDRFHSFHKKDDISDAICQLQAFKIFCFVLKKT